MEGGGKKKSKLGWSSDHYVLAAWYFAKPVDSPDEQKHLGFQGRSLTTSASQVHICQEIWQKPCKEYKISSTRCIAQNCGGKIGREKTEKAL